jgi:hypothetical protein
LPGEQYESTTYPRRPRRGQRQSLGLRQLAVVQRYGGYGNDGYRSGYNNTATSMGYGTIESIQVTKAEGPHQRRRRHRRRPGRRAGR